MGTKFDEYTDKLFDKIEVHHFDEEGYFSEDYYLYKLIDDLIGFIAEDDKMWVEFLHRFLGLEA